MIITKATTRQWMPQLCEKNATMKAVHGNSLPEDTIVLSGIESPSAQSKVSVSRSAAEYSVSRNDNAVTSAGKAQSTRSVRIHPKETRANPRFINIIDDDSMVKPAVNSKSESAVNSPSGVDITVFEDRLKSEMGPDVTIQNRHDIAALPGRIPSLSELNVFFDSIVQDRKIPWDFVTDGCFARSHVTCDRLIKEGWNCAKIFVMADPPENDASQADAPDYHLQAENRYTKGEWQYHVATLVFAKDEHTGEVDGYMLDGSINNDKPIHPSEWIRSFWNQRSPVRVDTTLPDTYCSPNESDSEEPHRFFKPEFDKFLEYAVKTNEKYATALEEIKKNIKV